MFCTSQAEHSGRGWSDQAPQGRAPRLRGVRRVLAEAEMEVESDAGAVEIRKMSGKRQKLWTHALFLQYLFLHFVV